MTDTYRYVGPDQIRLASLGTGPGSVMRSRADVLAWLRERATRDEAIAAFVVSLDGDLVLAPRESEHVAAAGGAAVRSAGELTLTPDGDVVAISNQSTGYCPEPSSWTAVAAALDRIGLAHPDRFTTEFEFRRCEACGNINLVKDRWFVCAVCDSPLPEAWNLG